MSDEPSVPPSFIFPKESLGTEQVKWLKLPNDGSLPEQSPLEIPGDWMAQREWYDILETSVGKAPNWYALLYFGVMRLEDFDAEGAKAAWQASIELKPSSWAWRNLLVLARLQNNEDEAKTVYASLPASIQINDRVQILRGRIALELSDWSGVEQVMKCEYAVVREGETELTDIWFEMCYRRMAEASQRTLDENDKAEIRKLYPSPARIDFRSIAK